MKLTVQISMKHQDRLATPMINVLTEIKNEAHPHEKSFFKFQ
ncbi:hypothetical protein [Sporosarcina sp. GW1-11]|nr:hypothetical protein [Sporosarcina sp. GW1-11]